MPYKNPEDKAAWRKRNPDLVKKHKIDYAARHKDKIDAAKAISEKKKQDRARSIENEYEEIRQLNIIRALRLAIEDMRSYIMPQNEAMRQGKVFCSKCKKPGTAPMNWRGSWRHIQCSSCIAESFRHIKANYKPKPKDEKYWRDCRKRQWLRIKNDPIKHIKAKMRCRISKAFRRAGESPEAGKSKLEYLGCTPKELRAYIQAMFKKGMSWDNASEWHIDHVIPIAAFDLSLESERTKAFHYTNLQPLWAEDNIKKGDSIPQKAHQPLLLL